MRTVLTGLLAGTAYNLQLRAVGNDGAVSEWSRTFQFTTATDTVPPKAPTNVAGSMSGTSFVLTWDAVTQSLDNSPAFDLAGYDILVASDTNPATRVFRTTNTRFELPLETNRSIFGTPQANIKLSVRSIDKAGNTTGYSTAVTQTNAAPANVTGLTVASLTNAISASWTANTDTDLVGYVAHAGTTAGFTPGVGTKVWEGTATSFVYQTIQYSTDLWVKVYAVDVFGTLSATPASAGPVRPSNPVSVDTTAPATPTGLAVTLTNATDGKSAKAAVTWTAVTDTDNDLAEYIIDYKPSAEAGWQTVKVSYDITSGFPGTPLTITGLLPYTNYDFRIRASDFSANLSAWSATVTKTATTNAAPAVPTGLAITAGKDNILVRWTANTEPDMANGAGVYDVTIATDSAFTTGVLQYRTGADNIAVNGLSTNQIYYARVRATDSGGQSSAYSASVNATTSSFPGTALSDGSVPSSSPAANVIGGPNYLYVYWSPITNADPVIYDVYMSTTNGFTTYDATTKVGEVSGTSIIIERTAAGAALAYGTTYYVKIRSRDRDGSATTAGTQGSAAPAKIASGDITSVNADLITSGTSFTTNLFIGAGGAIQSTGYTAGSTGFKLSNSGLIIEGAGNTVSASALKAGTVTATTINIGATGVLNVDSTGVIKSNNYAAGSTGYQLSNAGLQINDGDIDAKALRTNTAIIGDLTIGRSADALGTIKSFDYSAGTAGWKIGKGLFEINQGTIKAAAVQIQSGPNLIPTEYSAFEFDPAFYSGKLPTGGTVTIQPSGGKFGAQYLQMRNTAAAATEVVLGSSATDYNISVEAGKTYLVSTWAKTGTVASNVGFRVRWSDATYSTVFGSTALGASGPWTRIYGSILVPAGVTGMVVCVFNNTATINAGFDIDGVQVEEKIAGTNAPSTYSMPGATSISGYGIRTGEIRSTATVTVNGVSQPAWSINLSGGAQFGNANVRGAIIVGPSGADTDAGQSFISSGNYVANTTGWKISSSGNAEINTGLIRGDAVVNGTLSATKLATGELQAGVRVIAGSSTGSHAEMTDSGFYAYTYDPDSGLTREAVRMGTATNDMFAITDSAGDTIASISETGLISANGASLVETSTDVDGYPRGVEIYGTDFMDWDRAHGKVISSGSTGNFSLSGITSAVGLYEISWFAETGRSYRINVSLPHVQCTSQTEALAVLRLHITTDGTAPTINSTVSTATAIRSAGNTGRVNTPVTMFDVGAWGSNQLVRALISIAPYEPSTSTWTINSYYGTNFARPLIMSVEDIGWVPENTMIANNGSGGGGAPTAKKTYTSTWQATSSASYTATGGTHYYSPQLVQGYYSSANGDSYGYAVFGGNAVIGETSLTIANALSGATLQKAEVYLYANHWYYNSGGTAFIRPFNSLTITNAVPTGTVTTSANWPKPGGRWVTLSGATTSIRGISVGKANSTNLLYYGRFNAYNASSGKPLLRLTYTR